MKNTGFRIDAHQLARKLRKAKDQIRAEIFKPDVMQFVRVTLNDCVRTTPVRNAQLIQSAQHEQYDNRINAIPSVHTLVDPSLRVFDGVREMLYFGGKWYNPAYRLPPAAWGAYEQLRAERMRRLQTPRTAFVKHRVQARYLYRKSWQQVGNSLGLSVTGGGNVSRSLTRRQPPEAPPRGYGQVRGGKRVLNVLIYNPFLDTDYGPLTPIYKPFTASDILEPAIARHRQAFINAVNHRLQRALFAVMHS